VNCVYTTKDLYSYGGFILGTALTYVLLQEAGVEGKWQRLIPAVLVGMGFGWLGDRLHGSPKADDPPPR